MITSTVQYHGDLRTTCTHVRSSSSIITDAPVDNHGKGEAFSPTDLLATSLATCMLTTMGIRAMKENIPFPKASAEVTKIMGSNPRRVTGIVVNVNMSGLTLTDDQKKILEDTAINCPVAKSLHPEIRQEVSFQY
ncbi:MAG: OsmC family protein [Cyclobacteriaceae bacterium]|nr:OsmC family protein [Cyclobacteriaceae bacterium]